MLSSYLYSLYLLALLAILPLTALAAPTPARPLSRRQDSNQPFDGPRTITTNRVIQVTGGSIVEDCTITFTAIVVNGENLVRQERRCSELFVPTGQSLPPPSTVSQPPPATTTTTDAHPQTTQTPPDVSTTSSETVTTTPPADTTTPPVDTIPPVDTTSTTDSSTTTDVPPPVDTSTPPPPAESTTDSPSAPVETPPASTSDQSSETSSGVIVLGPTSVPAENANTPPAGGTNTATGTRENAETSQSAASVNIPGKEIEVLPIGLGVFAGISVIALIVVGLVTYERTKYRKAFRQRRLAASGAEMGYGGMSERR